MSTNHNRIRVADLEKNQPNKILKTNQNGELEFSDANNLQVESYNALDCTTEGKALDARQGKVLKDMIDNVNVSPPSLVNDLTTGGTTKALTAEMGKTLENTKLTASLATDAETQIASTVTEDKKVISRSKLFNWWEWVKKQSQTITAIWTFKLGIKVNNSTGNYIYSTQILEDMIIAQLTSAGYGTYKVQYGWNTIRMFNSNGYYTQLGFISSTQNNNVNLPNKSGTVALLNDFVTTAPGTATVAPLVIPNGVLTIVPQNGAIERDINGQLWETHNGVRSSLLTTNDINIDQFLATTWKSSITQTAFLNSSINSTSVKTVSLPSNALGSSDSANFLFKTFDKYHIKNSSYETLTPPASITFEVFLKGNDCTFGGNQYIKLYSSKRTDIQTNQSIRNCEIALHTNLAVINGNPASSSLSFSSLAYDNYGNVSQENFNQYYLQALNGNYIKFSNASISLEYRISCEFNDPTNINRNNAECRSIFDNFSSLFLKL
ncbi:hypothetical protein [Flavobacterium sp. KACC 22763]|uniref:hypothetical protein n=1 Tax=Flavobacterium sp. KACC 22763 TaxID=3025668 RepID=UPI00236553F7|nr:hypothetical protein [Flavobacterium sp. KACC 22763]WDF64520.1 hypothetical protein PQ463_23295 [Flavobacterium sp. KACC 22763]